MGLISGGLAFLIMNANLQTIAQDQAMIYAELKEIEGKVEGKRKSELRPRLWWAGPVFLHFSACKSQTRVLYYNKTHVRRNRP